MCFTETCRRLALAERQQSHVSACFSRFSYRYHIHGIPWYYGRGRREVVTVIIPLEEGGMVVDLVRCTGGMNCNLASQDDFTISYLLLPQGVCCEHMHFS